MSVTRSAANVWWVLFGDDRIVAALEADGAAHRLLPSQVLGAFGSAAVPAAAPYAATLLAKVELDVCGAWLTVANQGSTRPILVRRAGWVELRGHPRIPATGRADPGDDRIGLGPGDMLLMPSVEAAPHRDDSQSDALLDVALRAAGSNPAELVARVSSPAQRRYCAAVGVPAHLGEDPLARVATATGVALEEVQTPGYPLGDLQPDLWKDPPAPPRAARLRLTADRSNLRTVRSLLDRLLASWRLDGRVDDADLKLVATELSTNAVVHTSSTETITIRYLGDKIRIEVRDASDSTPRPQPPSLQAEGGRGMRLVETLSRSWGVEPTAAGKQVWCEVPLAVTG